MDSNASLPDPNPSLLEDLRSGEAGWLPRAGVSLAAGVALVGAAVLAVGLLDLLLGPVVASYTRSDGTVRTYTRSRIHDEHIALALLAAMATWFFALTRIWGSYRRRRKLLVTLFGLLAIWAVVIPLCVLIDAVVGRSEELLIGAIVSFGVAGSIILVATMGYRHARGRTIVAPGGLVHVRCPSCGYSMVGLSQSRCPECGQEYTIDELIRRQDYEALRRRGRKGKTQSTTPPTAEPITPPPDAPAIPTSSTSR